ncbi:hypothetical protein CBA19C8_35215 [Paraburkholderia terrae]|nr:hypothetical protein CBA19C8_35215 [Paraburkholderia terrae]
MADPAAIDPAEDAQLGKQDNCQLAVSLSVANGEVSLPVAYQLYLPQEWADDPARRQQAGVPEEIDFATKPPIAITQLREARQCGGPNAVVLADAGYGNDTAFRDGVGELGLQYAVGIQSSTRVWPPGLTPLPAKTSTGKAGRPRSLQRRVPGHNPVAVKDLALALEPSCYHTISWRERTRGALSSRFAALRVRTSHRDYWRAAPRDEEWLLIEWPVGELEPTKYWLSTLPKCAGALSVTTRVSSRSLALDTSRGVDFIITHPYALPPVGFSSHSASMKAVKKLEFHSAPALPADYIPRGSPAHAAIRT